MANNFMENNKSNLRELAGEWFSKAHDDELSSKNILDDKRGAPSTVCFLSQQMAEKFLKGYLVYNEKELLKIHDLDKLIKLCEEIDNSFIEIEDRTKNLSDFYISTRYPGDYPEFTWSMAEKAFESADIIKKFVLEKIK